MKCYVTNTAHLKQITPVSQILCRSLSCSSGLHRASANRNDQIRWVSSFYYCSRSYSIANICFSARNPCGRHFSGAQTRRSLSHGSSSNKTSNPIHGSPAKPTQSTDLSTAAASSIAKSKQKPKRRKKPFSPINQIKQNHPKNSSSPTTTRLTRKQLLRLTAKQRANYKLQRIEEYKASRTYLDQARTNVRSNLKFLKGTAESNLKKNIQTIKRLFNGEEVWKEDVTVHETSKNIMEKNQESLEWGKLPNAIQSNFKHNVSTIQNWLHKITDGAIPSPNLSTSTSGSGSVATRIQQFHEMKAHQPLVMDNKWIAWNVLLALTPGFLVHLYCLSLQDEMKEYHARVEEKERERLQGPGASGRSSEGGMGLSSALVTEGGGFWDKVKIAVNDLFLADADEKVNHKGASADDVGRSEPSESITPADETATITQQNDNSATPTDCSDDKDATIDVLLQRIQALEKQVGITKQPDPQQTKHEAEPVSRSPIRNRRDDYMRSLWRKKDEENKEQSKNDADESSTLQMLTDIINNLRQFDSNVFIEWINIKCEELAKQLPFSIQVVEEKPNGEALPNTSEILSAEIPERDSKLLEEHITKTDIEAVDLEPSRGNEDDKPNLLHEDASESKRSRWIKWWSKLLLNRQRNKPVSEGQIKDNQDEEA